MQPYGRIVSAPTRLRVTTAHQDLRHVKTLRTIYMMVPDNAEEVPTRIIITSQDGMKQTLYIEKDEQYCPFCKVPGHPLSKCKKRQLQDKDFPEFSQPVSRRLYVRNNRRESAKPTENSAHNLMPQFNASQAAKENNEPQENTVQETMEKKKEENQQQSSLWGDLIDTGDTQQKQQIEKEAETSEFSESTSNEMNQTAKKLDTNMEIIHEPQNQPLESENEYSENTLWTDLTSDELLKKLWAKVKRTVP